MAVPTIADISPTPVPYTGRRLVRVEGTGFNTWAVPAPNAGMEADIDGVATTVRVCSGTLCFVTTTLYTGEGPTHTAQLKLRNLDSSGDPVPGEEVVASLPYAKEAFVHPDAAPFAEQVITGLVTRMLAHYNFPVTLSADVDYTPDGFIVRKVEEPPAIAITDFVLELADDQRIDELVNAERAYRDTLLFKLRSSFLLVSRSSGEALRYLTALYQFQRRVPYLEVEGVRVKFKLDNRADLAFNVGEGIKTWSVGFSLDPIVIECPEDIGLAFEALEVSIETTKLDGG